MYEVKRKVILNDAAFEMDVYAPLVAKKCEPGQFIIARVGEDGERIPCIPGYLYHGRSGILHGLHRSRSTGEILHHQVIHTIETKGEGIVLPPSFLKGQTDT
jgi:NAD(P)H-flavin reductase